MQWKMLCHNSNNNSNSNCYKHKNCCSVSNANSNLLCASTVAHVTASALAPKQRSSSYKKYRRAKSPDDGYYNTDISKDNNNAHFNTNAANNRPSDNAKPSNSLTTAALQHTPSKAPYLDGAQSANARLGIRNRRKSWWTSSSSLRLPSWSGICNSTLGLSLSIVLLFRLVSVVSGLAVGVDTTNVNATDLGSPGGYSRTYYILYVYAFSNFLL
ncbi:phosphatidylinositol 3,4,5-trisphosphate 3-phosphatase cnrN-like [Eurosta solidaginis]|uniref:phosphatidylinositol 3,4,5-trisphosphate 3-phosphatase cnrN-like n=1 Tax=Eurosta solidaginis TaxID=178769 RepID=UPI00353139D0